MCCCCSLLLAAFSDPAGINQAWQCVFSYVPANPRMVLTVVPVQCHAHTVFNPVSCSYCFQSSIMLILFSGPEIHLNLEYISSVNGADLPYKMCFSNVADLVLCRIHNRKESGNHCWEASKTIISSFIWRTLDSLVTCESVKSHLVILLHKAASLCMSAFDTARF